MNATATTAPVISYRKTREGDWAAFGPREALLAGVVTFTELGDYLGGYDEVAPAHITITKRSGEEKAEWLRGVSRGFDIDGTEYAYGYIYSMADRSAAANAATNRYEH